MAKAGPETRKRSFGQLVTSSCVGGIQDPICFAEPVKMRGYGKPEKKCVCATALDSKIVLEKNKYAFIKK